MSQTTSEKTIHSVGIIMNGVTGRMGLNQHLRRSIYAIMQQGGVKLSPSEVIMPKPILVGRNSAKLEAISAECGGIPWSTNLDKELANPANSIYFDSQTTDRRAADVKKAIAAGKNIYCEKPVSDSLDVALELPDPFPVLQVDQRDVVQLGAFALPPHPVA